MDVEEFKVSEEELLGLASSKGLLKPYVDEIIRILEGAGLTPKQRFFIDDVDTAERLPQQTGIHTRASEFRGRFRISCKDIGLSLSVMNGCRVGVPMDGEEFKYKLEYDNRIYIAFRGILETPAEDIQVESQYAHLSPVEKVGINIANLIADMKKFGTKYEFIETATPRPSRPLRHVRRAIRGFMARLG